MTITKRLLNTLNFECLGVFGRILKYSNIKNLNKRNIKCTFVFTNILLILLII